MESLYTYQRNYRPTDRAAALAQVLKLRNEASRRAMLYTAVLDGLKAYDGKVFNKRATDRISTEVFNRSGINIHASHESWPSGRLHVKLTGWDSGSSFQYTIDVLTNEGNRYDHAATVESTSTMRAQVEESVVEYQRIADNIDIHVREYHAAVESARSALARLGTFASIVNG